MLDLPVTRCDAVSPLCVRERISDAIPLPGRPLGTMVERLGVPVQTAVHAIQSDIQDSDQSLSWLFEAGSMGAGARHEADSLRASWMVCAIALVHAARFKATNFEGALRWFFSNDGRQINQFSFLSEKSIKAITLAVCAFDSPQKIQSFLPYVLEPHGHVTRSRLERTTKGSLTRESKRENGVFYTPADVAEFLVDELARGLRGCESWCDPACGTGVFLRVALKKMHSATSNKIDAFEMARRQIFGMDVSAIALEMAAFVLLVECLAEGGVVRHSPFESWRMLRQNLVCMDAIQGRCIHDTICNAKHFAAASSEGFDRLILNPPYGNQAVALSSRRNWITLSGAVGPTIPVQIAFVEMMWRLTKPDAAAAAVLPLSVAANTQKAHRVFRQHLASFPGKKDFLFFDREPQSLFGEDVKTRNTILFLEKGREKGLFTSSLLKWTAPQRPGIFSRSRLVSLRSLEFGQGIPRLGSSAEVDAYERLKRGYALRTGREVASLSYRELRNMRAEDQNRTLLLGPTAYNYVNCFPSDALAEVGEDRFSESALHALTFPDRDSLLAAYAVFSSRLCFWLWRAEGDGFHLNREFLNKSPLWLAIESSSLRADLAGCGAALWESSKSIAVRSVNAGRVTYAFPSSFDSPEAKMVEHLLLVKFGIDHEFSEELNRIVVSTVSIDGRRRSRAVGVT